MKGDPARSLAETRERTRGGDDPTAPRREPVLLLLFECDRPLAASTRHSLSGLEEVFIGRSSQRRCERRGRTLEIRLPDQRASKRHARLVRRRDQWIAEDLGSRNGTIVNGDPQTSAPLDDGDCLEIGYTLFLFREQADAGFPSDYDAAATAVPGLATFVPALRRSFVEAARIASSSVPILIQGESGSGKERAAAALHQLSGRPGPFVAVNCGALPGELVESELFGHRKGAFSGAVEDRPGLVRSADGGTLFLDEIADLSLPSQAALLRVLQEREVTPVGAVRPVSVDLRVVAATHHDLGRAVEQGVFRRDLFARIAGYTLELPPVRERPEDLGLLVGALLGRLAQQIGRDFTLTIEAGRALLAHDWPLNVRELEHALGVAAALAEDGRIRVDYLPPALRPGARPASGALDDSERRQRDELVELLRRHDGNVSAAAREIGKSRMQVHRWIKRFGVDPGEFR